jgi:restriction system protein
MAIPKFYQLFPDVLRSLSHFDEILAKDFSALVMNQLELTAAELAEQNPGGGNRVRSRVHWAVAYLVQAGAIERPARGVIRLTGYGQDLLNGPIENLSKEVLD